MSYRPVSQRPSGEPGTVRAFATEGRAGGGLLERVGRTPLLELHFPALPKGVRLFAKLESVNPGGSLKDRPVARILTQALAEGELSGDRRLLDSSSGNAGIAYAMFGAALGVGVTLVIPGNASKERLERIAAHGAEIILTDPIEGYDFALREAQRLATEQPERYWHADQYANENNWLAHYETTGAEILEQTRVATGGPPDAFVAGVGTGGHPHRGWPSPQGVASRGAGRHRLAGAVPWNRRSQAARSARRYCS